MNPIMRDCLLLTGLMLTLLASAPPQHVAAQPSDIPLALQWSSTESDRTQSVAWGDVDGDGDLDLAVGNDGQPNQLYRNDAGTLTTAATWSSIETDNTRSVAWGDVDGDGDLDLVVGNDGQPNRLYRNDAGTLTTAAWSSAKADSTWSVVWGDADGDGDLDLAVGNWDQPNRLYRNDAGTLTTTAVWSSTEADYTSSVAWGDVDGDGDLDLAVGNQGVVPTDAGQPNRLYRNDGGELTAGAVWSSAETDLTASVAWGDVDGDGDLDLAVGNVLPGLSGGQSNRLYRNDAGTLTTAAVWSSTEADETQSLAWGDVDGDGDLDLAAGNDRQPNRLYRNDDGALVAGAVWSSVETDATRSIAWGDYDGDGDLDLAVGNAGQPNRLYRNNGALLTPDAAWSSDETNSTSSVAWGDVDGDGDLDLAAGNSDGPNQLYRNEAGTLTTAAVWSSDENDSTTSVAWGDVDGDGDLDLAVGNSNQPNRLYRNDNGTLTTSAVWSSDEADGTQSVAWADYDGDGDLDLAAGNDLHFDFGCNCHIPDPIRVYRNDGGVLTTSAVWSSDETDSTWDVAWGDYDGDGDLDLAAGNLNEPNRLYRNDSGVLTTSAVWSSSEADATTSLAWGDYDGDGDTSALLSTGPDLAVGNLNQPNRLYLNDDGTLTTSAVWSSDEADETESVMWGDYDGDGDLDLVVGNLGRPVSAGFRSGQSRLYRNDAGSLTPSATWSSREIDHVLSVAWGDADGDGDLDLAVGSWGSNRLYRNLRRGATPLMNRPPQVTLPRPGGADDAGFFSASDILQATNIPIAYTLRDPEGDSVARIFPEFSSNGGGQWLPATPGPGGDGLTDLTASPEGTPHTFVWHAEADLIRSDNVVFRIRAQPSYTHSPILWPAVDGKSPLFRVAAPWYVRVVTESGIPVAGARLYADGQEIGVTDRAGLFNPGPLKIGTALVALAQQAKQPTGRAAHSGWAFATDLTSLVWARSGQAQPFVVSRSGEQQLVVRRDSPLVRFNLVVSVEWDATDEYLDQIARAVQRASDYLYDLTDGQMAFGEVNIYDNAEYWADADIQISTKNTVRPHAYVGGITSDDTSHVIRVGRHWDGDSGNQGAWDEPDGYRTLAHEFGHYALSLYDEYFAYIFDDLGNLIEEAPASCTGPENRNPATDPTNASAMDYHYTSSELAMRGVPGLWSNRCEATAQWQLNGESDWETLTRMYSDRQTSPRWQLTTPADRGEVMAGPSGLPESLPAWPVANIHQAGPSTPPRQLTVHDPEGPYWGAIVALYKLEGRVIGQGFTNSGGQLDVYGAVEGDVLRAASFDGGLAGSVTVGSGLNLTLTLEPVGGTAMLATRSAATPPHLRVVAEPSPDPSQIDLLVALHNFGPGADPSLIVTEPGSQVGHAPTLSYSPTTGTYEGQLSFSATQRGMGSLRAVGAQGNSLVRLQTTYRLQRVAGDGSQDVYSDDGDLALHLEPGSLPGAEAYLVVMPPGAAPGPLPAGRVLVGDPYDVTASGALATLEKPAILKLHYDKALVAGAPAGLGVYRWDPNADQWQWVPGRVDAEQAAVIAAVRVLGTYALLAPVGLPPTQRVLLPLILKDLR